MSEDTVTLYYSPQTRACTTLALLHELDAPYELVVLNMKCAEQRHAPYLAINPMGKVPAIRHREHIITEQVAIFLYLTELFPATTLAPLPGTPRRGDFLRWMAFYAACFEPALVDRALQRTAGPREVSPYGDFDTVFSTVDRQVSYQPYLLGDEMCAADLLWGGGINWGYRSGLLPASAALTAYARRIASRTSFRHVAAADAELVAAHEAAARAAS